MKVAYDAQALGPNQWAVRKEPGGVQARVTSDCELYEENLEDYDLWTYGSCVFPRVALVRDDVRDGDYPSLLRRLLVRSVSEFLRLIRAIM